jgi:hypothetical protein
LLRVKKLISSILLAGTLYLLSTANRAIT